MQSATFYFDNMNVLGWIQGHGLSFHSYVANLIGEIQMVTEPSQWHHISYFIYHISYIIYLSSVF